MKKNLFLLIFITIFFTACSQKNIPIKDLENYSQEPKDYLNKDLSFKNQKNYNQDFYKNYFKVWEQDTLLIDKKSATWGFKYKKRAMYLQNFSKASSTWFNKHIENSNFEEFNKQVKKAIVIRNSNLKVFPTNEMMFYNPNNAGQGFPFDYNQNSYIKINTPILVSHFSKDKAWVFVESYFAYGWLKIDDIAFVDKKFIDSFKTKNYSTIIKDKLNIYDEYFIEKVQLGTILPKYKNKYIVAKKDQKHNAYLKFIDIAKENITDKPLEFNNVNLEKIAKELIDEQYGWGGIFGFRDCSSFTQDFFIAFGINLDRNSRKQTTNGKYYKFENLSNKQKKEFILKYAKPFKTLVYLYGHIMLYIGEKNNEPLVMHNVWGVKTRVFFNTKGRNIIGKSVITTLEFGKELQNYDDTKNTLDRIEGIVILDEK
ncbi:hypothetical protein CRU99_03800 [Malaciobacter mytili]|uniref:SH3 domain-containing protein n=1 Tax=Malaciobacter mytili TaxID=603050 RepID=UPI00100BD985|nr:SH3 domain-containing protein [Malaciobacter mytili]RXI45433.1 hypothetical protein CRU99_03800 [Malaciobacter mytili]